MGTMASRAACVHFYTGSTLITALTSRVVNSHDLGTLEYAALGAILFVIALQCALTVYIFQVFLQIVLLVGSLLPDTAAVSGFCSRARETAFG